jgi:predicted metal-dependent phosphoesterase TrpH
MFADLHLHTFFSDGTFSPEEVVEHGKRLGFGALALTDHDTVEGCERMAAACAAARIDFIAGSELTAEFGEHELHILGYFLDTRHPRLLGEMAKFQEVRQNRIREMVARINELGVPLEADAVLALANCRAPGRPHVARALVKAGLCGNLDEAFERFLKKHRPAWVPKMKMSATDAIALIHEAGGLAVMAHPGLNKCDEVIPELVKAGLDGIECYHTKHNKNLAAHYLNIARQYGLLVTGGSDCHGLSKGKPLIGGIKLPIHYVHKMQKAQRCRLQVESCKSPAPSATRKS